MDNQTQAIGFSYGSFVWWTGVVESRDDPLQLGRLQVRVIGYHTDNKAMLPTEDLFYAMPVQPITSAAMNGIGTTPTGIVAGTTVLGFFMDGSENQIPMILGTIGGKPEAKVAGTTGFSDPTETYPLRLGEPDTNRLATNDSTNQHPVLERGGDVGTSAFGGSFTEPSTEYAALYPYNHVKETESGHIEEWDDTPDVERYLRYHKSGTFYEIYPNGSEVNHVVSNSYNVINGASTVHITGNSILSIDGDLKLRVGGNYDVEVLGNKVERISGSSDVIIGNGWTVTTGSTSEINSGGSFKITSPRIDLN